MPKKHEPRDAARPISSPAKDRASSVTNRQLRRILETGVAADPFAEMQSLFGAMLPAGRSDAFLSLIHHDMQSIFAGKIRGFRKNTLQYHDWHHTRDVALATLRLLHGLHSQGLTLPPEMLHLSVACAYFHDAGLLRTTRDSAGPVARHLKNHEERSIVFSREYLADQGMEAELTRHCAPIINSTNLAIEPRQLDFASESTRLAGYALGTADILAQMADRYYIERLPILYREQRQAGIQQHASPLALMQQTSTFYHQVIEKRLRQGFGNVCGFMRFHFQSRHQLDRDLYMEFIDKNMAYLNCLLRWHQSGKGDLARYLRRRLPQL
ncbi:MAG: hypothetical protein ACK5PS_10880 [Desulfopila sp.]